MPKVFLVTHREPGITMVDTAKRHQMFLLASGQHNGQWSDKIYPRNQLCKHDTTGWRSQTQDCSNSYTVRWKWSSADPTLSTITSTVQYSTVQLLPNQTVTFSTRH